MAGGIFPIDPGLGYPPGAVPEQTWHGSIHDLSGLAVFEGLALATVATAVALRGRARGFSWYSAVTGVVVAVSFVATSVLAAMAYSGAWPAAPSGLTERVALYPAMVWFAWLCRRSARANP